VSSPSLIASTVEQMRNMVLALKLGFGEQATPLAQTSRELLGDLEGVLAELATLASQAPPPAPAPERWAEGTPAALLPDRLAEATSCDLAEVIHRARERHTRIFAPEIRFEEQLEVNRAPVGVAARWIERILLDLLLRARDVTPEGGVVRLRLEAGDTFVRLTIQDGARLPTGEPELELVAFWSRLIGPGNLALQSRLGQGNRFVLTLPLGAPSRRVDHVV
jgi:signal transduction histidine kinase